MAISWNFWLGIGAFLICPTSQIFGGDFSLEDPGLTDRHGPWMIHVATLGSAGHTDRAASIVKELRSMNLPAYSVSRIIKVKKDGRELEKTESIVLAGNYVEPDSNITIRTLKFIQQFSNPDVTKLLPSDAVSPFKDAYIRKNPLAESVVVRQSKN
jgi:hypothetical protein